MSRLLPCIGTSFQLEYETITLPTPALMAGDVAGQVDPAQLLFADARVPLVHAAEGPAVADEVLGAGQDGAAGSIGASCSPRTAAGPSSSASSGDSP